MNAYETLIQMEDDSSQQECYLEACIELMDNDLRGELHRNITSSIDEASFLKLYCDAHKTKFNEEFIVN